jgi:hypothetical protein
MSPAPGCATLEDVSEVFRFHVQPSLGDSSFEGWNDAGEAASAAARFFTETVPSAPLAELDPEEFYDFTVNRPRVALKSGVRTLAWPTVEFRYGTVADGRGLVVGVGPEPHLRWRRFTEEVLELARRCRVKRAVLLGAFLADVVYSRPVRVSGFSSTPDRIDSLALETSTYEGPTGIVGVLADHLAAVGVEVVSLWAALPHYIEASPNPRGALALVQKAKHYLALSVDDAPLQQSAAEFEQSVSALVASDPALTEYVRALKKREFAQ